MIRTGLLICFKFMNTKVNMIYLFGFIFTQNFEQVDILIKKDLL